MELTNTDISKIAEVLGVEIQRFESGWSWRIFNKEAKQLLVVTIYANAELGANLKGALISIQSQHGYFELHDCLAYMVLEPDEIIFLNAQEDRVSCMIIGKSGSCSMFSNINRTLLKSDFASLDPASLLSAMQLSLVEGLISE